MSSLESLIAKRDEVRQKLETFLREKDAEEGKWKKTIVNELGQEVIVIDYHAWKDLDKESYEKYAEYSEDTALEFISWLEEEIRKKKVFPSKCCHAVTNGVIC